MSVYIITNISVGEGGRSMRISSPGCQHTYYFTATDLKYGVPGPHFSQSHLKVLLTSEVQGKLQEKIQAHITLVGEDLHLPSLVITLTL